MANWVKSEEIWELTIREVVSPFFLSHLLPLLPIRDTRLLLFLFKT